MIKYLIWIKKKKILWEKRTFKIVSLFVETEFSAKLNSNSGPAGQLIKATTIALQRSLKERKRKKDSN